MATASVPADLYDRTTRAALEEKSKLQKHFGRFDMLFFLVCTLVGLDTIGTVANKGAQGFTWLIFLGIFFFFPGLFLPFSFSAKLDPTEASSAMSKSSNNENSAPPRKARVLRHGSMNCF